MLNNRRKKGTFTGEVACQREVDSSLRDKPEFRDTVRRQPAVNWLKNNRTCNYNIVDEGSTILSGEGRRCMSLAAEIRSPDDVCTFR